MAELLDYRFLHQMLCSFRNCTQIIELRKGLEPEGVYLAARRADRTDISKIKACLLAMAEAIERGEHTANSDLAFHRALIKATHNPAYCNVHDTIAVVFNEGMQSSQESLYMSEGQRLAVLEDYRLIYDAIKKKQPEKARDFMRRHLEKIEEHLYRPQS